MIAVAAAVALFRFKVGVMPLLGGLRRRGPGGHAVAALVALKEYRMDALIQPLPFDAAGLPGLSAKLIASHHQNNYGGAVKRLNAIRGRLAAAPFATTPGFELNGLKREELIATNSMLLHELYFASLGGDGVTMEPPMTLALEANFGSVERWRDEFVAMGEGAWPAARAGCCWRSSRARARWSTSGAPTTRTRWPAACRSWRSTCTSMPTTSTTAPPRPRMSMPS